MKPLSKSLLVAFFVSLVTVSTSWAETNPIGRPKTEVASYKTGIYTTLAGKLSIALDKQSSGPVDIRLKNAAGKNLFFQHLTKNQPTTRIRLDLSELPDGAYQVEISNGIETTVHSVTLSTNQPSAANRLVAIN